MKRIIFLSGTRADFGKLKSLIEITNRSENFEVHIFATGMHMQSIYGDTVNEIEKCGYPNIYKYINHSTGNTMDLILARTIEGLSGFCHEVKPDLIIIHGDRVEALAGAIVGALNNILVAHIEGGELSGTIDELIRHAVSKMSHTHFVANEEARKRLIQMGEEDNSIFVIGSPDVDLMLSDDLPDLPSVKAYYEIGFDKYALVLFHPVTTEVDQMEVYAHNFVNALQSSDINYVIIYPNNDLGTAIILKEYGKLANNPRLKIFPSIRFESFLTLLKNAQFIIGNSSSGIREAPYYGIPSINIGTRQFNRSLQQDIINCGYSTAEIIASIAKAVGSKPKKVELYGAGKSDELFCEILIKDSFWKIKKQKQFKDMV